MKKEEKKEKIEDCLKLFRGVFTVHISIEFHAKWNKSDLITNWFLSFANAGSQKSLEIGFQKSMDNIN